MEYSDGKLYLRVDEPVTWDDNPGQRFIHYELAPLADIKAWVKANNSTIVPFEPTEEMLQAAALFLNDERVSIMIAYRKMIAAAQNSE